MDNLKEVLLKEIEEFRVKGHKFYNEEITTNEFKHSSGGMGVYAERGGKSFMVRLRIPSGVMSVEQLEHIWRWAEKYKVSKVHFTTRQAIQYHGLSIDSICDLMIDALNEGIYTRGAGGNFPRNVALSPLSGVDKEEAFNPTNYAVATGNYFIERILTYKLPRKLKVSFSNSESDTAHCTVQDLGFLAVNKDGKKYFKVYIGGGLGRNPKLALEYPELIEPKDVLHYVEAVVNLFVAEGDYENRGKARLRYVVDRLGENEFIERYKKHVTEAKNNDLSLEVESLEIVKTGTETILEGKRIYKQKQKGLYSVYVHPTGGQIKTEDLKNIVNTLKKYKDIEIRLSMTEGAYIINLNSDEAKEILDITENIGGKSNFEQSVSCIGVPVCQIGIANSQETLNEIISYVAERSINLELLPRIYISGCHNSCGVHEIGAIGLTGKKKRVNDKIEEVYELHVNGSFNTKDAKLGQIYGDIMRKDIPMFIYELNEVLKIKCKKFNEFIKDNKEDMKNLIEKYTC